LPHLRGDRRIRLDLDAQYANRSAYCVLAARTGVVQARR
jgi:hypothetical protein